MISLKSATFLAAALAWSIPGLADPIVQPSPAEAAEHIEVSRLRQALVHEVRNAVRHDPASDPKWIDLARAELSAADATIDHPQLIVVVDRNPRVQQLRIISAAPQGSWEVVGGSRISTGERGRFDHYITPTGVFHVTDAILGYRAEGTLNENGIRGLGAKGMRVWDFGWQVAMKGWSEAAGKPDRTPIRLMLHATDPDKLEQRLGRQASQGCVRLPGAMNRFLDQHGVLDAVYERVAVMDIRFRALLLPGREPSSLAGNTLVIVDSAQRPATTGMSASATPFANHFAAKPAPGGLPRVEITP